MTRPIRQFASGAAGRPRHGPWPCQGMTLIELLVSLGVLAVISVAFATILAQSQKVVNRSNVLMRANATASAISQVLRDDLACFCPQGFLAIHHYNNDPNYQRLIFTSLGPFSSLTANPPVTANAARIDYGWTNSNTPADPNDDLIWRRATLLQAQTPSGADPDPNDDVDPYNWLGRYDPSSPAPIDLNSELGNYSHPPTIPRDQDVNVTNLGELWPLLARPCTKFQVSWWNGTGWDLNAHTWTATDFAAGKGPAAIKVNFRLKTGDRPEEYLDYDVICPLRP